jgi:hypothetical protein
MANINVTNSGSGGGSTHFHHTQDSIWGDFSSNSVKISPIADHEAILVQSDEQSLLRYHVRDNALQNSIVMTGVQSYNIDGSDFYITYTINTQERALPLGYHYFIGNMGPWSGYLEVTNSTINTITVYYPSAPFTEGDVQDLQGLPSSNFVEIYINAPSIYSQFRARSNGAYIQNANWTESPTYSYDWHFDNDGITHAPGEIRDNYGDVRSIPQINKYYSGGNTINIDNTYSGKHIYFTYDGGSDAIFLPDDGSLNLPIGFTFTIVTDDNNSYPFVYINANDSGLTRLTAVGLAYASGGYDAGVNSIATVMKVDSNRWIISGHGVVID